MDRFDYELEEIMEEEFHEEDFYDEVEDDWEDEEEIEQKLNPLIHDEEAEKIEATYIQNDDIPFEPWYEDIKHDPNVVWFNYESGLQKYCGIIARNNSFSYDELLQVCYIRFRELCDKYDPYYEGGFIPFHKFLFSSMYQILRAHTQRYYYKGKREQVNDDICKFSKSDNIAFTNIKRQDSEFDLDFKEALKYLPNRTREVIIGLMNGYLQTEIGDMQGISQSRVCTIYKTFAKHVINIANNLDNVDTYRCPKDIKKAAIILAPYVKNMGERKKTAMNELKRWKGR